MRDVQWEDIFKLRTSTVATEFCQWVKVEIDVYIPRRKCQIKSHSSQSFSAAFATAIAHGKHLFCLYQKDKSSDTKVKFKRVVIVIKG